MHRPSQGSFAALQNTRLPNRFGEHTPGEVNGQQWCLLQKLTMDIFFHFWISGIGLVGKNDQHNYTEGAGC
jgi:hypothetical protein